MNRIYIANEQDAVPVTPKLRGLIRRSVNAALRHVGFPRDAEVSVTAVDNERIRTLNREYRGKDAPTDVLSFPLGDEADGDGTALLGDIVLSLETCRAQAEAYGHGLFRETAFLTVHSVLHLLGYDHETSKEDERAMFALQDEIMKTIRTDE